MKFRNSDDILKYYQEQLSKGNNSAFKDIKSQDGQSFSIITNETLTAEANRLKNCIQKHIEDYYNSYTPNYYIRTNGLKNALTVQASVQSNGNKRYIGLYFDESKSWGKSLITEEWNGWKPYLINTGWKDTSRIEPYFQGYRGYGFIEKGIRDWKQNLKYSIDIEFSDSSLDFLNRIL